MDEWGEAAISTWRYRRADCATAVEYSLVHGHAVGLPAHFHDEDQFTFVRVGQRRFVIGGDAIIVRAGRGLLLPAGLVHRSLPEPEGASALNVYMPAGTYDLDEIWRRSARDSSDGGRLCAREMASLIESCRRGHALTRPELPSRSNVSTKMLPSPRTLGREAYCRAFARRHGLPPAAHGRAMRLNQARALLRAGESIAAAAVDSGFVDQSHLGRLFKKHFGTTPDQYRRGLSQAYQTRS